MRTGKIIDIECRCGYLLFRYFKAGKGRLIKCIVQRLTEDRVGLSGLPTYSKPVCPSCKKELGIIMMIHGSPALKLNQGTIKSIRI
ncbi:MAG: hypothetical protein GX122_08515 [Candidatus Cloacimonetes bacterium]|nr:hypothetical protein [Candidatus Cloacimonadota bacterium]NLO12444.1 hypothetical protein [Candidatus Cloacimonadota bacterium]